MKEYLNYNGLFSKMAKKDLEWLFIKLRDYKLKQQSDLGLDSSLSFGVEIEFEDILLYYVEKAFNENKILKNWLKTEDKSCSYKIDGFIVGGEIDSPILHDTKENWENLKCALNILKELRANITEKNGLHVHVGSQVFKEDINNVVHFIKLWCVFQPIIFRFAYGTDSRGRNPILSFAQPINPEITSEIMSCKLNNIEKFKFLGFDKKHALNFLNYRKLITEEQQNNTIEIRCANGTLNFSIIQNTINFYLKLMIYASSNTFDNDLIDFLFKKTNSIAFEEYSNIYIKNALLLADLIFDNNLDKINFFKQYIKKDDVVFIR